jgi:hypothetical protein
MPNFCQLYSRLGFLRIEGAGTSQAERQKNPTAKLSELVSKDRMVFWWQVGVEPTPVIRPLDLRPKN